MSNGMDRDKIAQRAYQIYEARGKVQGSDFSDWIQAEKELSTQEKSQKQSSKKKVFPY
jgi:outer membrane protein TolC